MDCLRLAQARGRQLGVADSAGESLTGRQVYERFLKNRFRASYQELRVVSVDPGGSSQETAFSVSLQDLRDENDQAVDGTLARTLVEVTAPFDMRHTAFLMVAKDVTWGVMKSVCSRLPTAVKRGISLINPNFSVMRYGKSCRPLLSEIQVKLKFL